MASCVKRAICSVLLIIFVINTNVTGYEKTLRKIVRNQSKMVQRPFSEHSATTFYKNATLNSLRHNQAFLFPGVSQGKTMYHTMQRPRLSMMSSAVQTTKDRKMPTFSKSKYFKIAPAINTIKKTTVPENKEAAVSKKTDEIKINSTQPNNITIKNFYQVPAVSRFFPPIYERDSSFEDKAHNTGDERNNIIVPEKQNMSKAKNQSTPIKRLIIPKTRLLPETEVLPKKLVLNNTLNTLTTAPEHEIGSTLFIEGVPIDARKATYNVTVDPVTCLLIKESKTDINTQEKFLQLDIEPQWMPNMQYWNKMFDNRYESLMRSTKWPSLKVILLPRVHVDTIWKKTFEEYHKDSVGKIITNIIKKLQFYSGLTFSWNEVSHLSYWWKSASVKNRAALRKLVKQGRFEITTGGWVETDEATSQLFGMVHQLIEGHQWLKLHLNYTPKVAWLTHSVSHSSTMVYLLSMLDIHHIVITNLHYAWEQYLAEYQYSDFIWMQNWDHDKAHPTKLNDDLTKLGDDRYPKHSAITHYLQFNSAGFNACGPNGQVCIEEFNFASFNKNLDINPYNIKIKSEKLLEQYSKTGTISHHNTMIAPIGGAYHYETQAEFDYQYHNYMEMADFINANKEIYKANIQFGTAEDYFSNIISRHKNYPTLKGDFFNFADLKSKRPAYWSGYFTTRPFTKILLRRLESTLRSTEILFSFALNFNVFRRYNLTEVFGLLIKSRESVARLNDRNVIGGTITANILRNVHSTIMETVKDCRYIQEISASFLTSKVNHEMPYLQKYVYRDGEFMSSLKSVAPGDQIYIFNSLSHERVEIVEIVSKYPNIRILDLKKKKDVTVQINPIWKTNCDNIIELSRKYFKVSFAVVLPPLSFVLYAIKETYDASHNAATIYCLACVVENSDVDIKKFPFKILPIRTGDIQLESYKHRLVFDEYTGFLKTVFEKDTNMEKTVIIDYGAFIDSNFNSGMFLFNTNTSYPLHDILKNYKLGNKSKHILIISGQVTTELVSIFGRLLQHTTKIFNILRSPLSNVIYLESKVDYELSPKNRDVEMFLSIQTAITNGNPPKLFTDSNGFQYAARYLNLSKHIESNIYPITNMAFIQDKLSRLTYLTDHAQGVTALQEGQLVVMLNRRVLYNDGRGTNEGLADNNKICNRHYLLLENFGGTTNSVFSVSSLHNDLILPSISAIDLANSLNYISDIFLIEKNKTDHCYYTFLPLVKTTFPCDISLLNYRVLLNKGNLRYFNPGVAHMILHRQSFSCKIVCPLVLRCQEEKTFTVDNIFRNTKGVFQTNLAGTVDGKPLVNLNLINFPPMELFTLMIAF